MGTEPVLWYYAQGTERRGPVTDDKLAQLVALGEVTPDTLLWNASLPGWVAARTIFATPPPLRPPAPPLGHSPAATVPVSVLVAQPQSQTPVASVIVKKMSVLQMIVLTVITFGFYYNIWFLRRRAELNNLLSKRKLGAAPIIVSLLAGAVSIILEISFPAADKGVAGVFRLVESGCLLFAAVRVANMIDDHCRAMGKTSNVRSGFAGCGVIFFGAFWLQHCINKYLRPAQQPGGDDAEESSFFPRTMKTPTRVAFGSLAVLGVLFVVFLVIGMLGGSGTSSPVTQSGTRTDAHPPAPPAPTTGNEVYLTWALLQLNRNGNIESLKGCAYRGAPNFIVDTVVDDWVIYEFDPGADEPNIQFAVEQQSGQYYGAGQRMNVDDYYEVTGSGTFKTVLDQTKMVPVGRRADPSLRHCQR